MEIQTLHSIDTEYSADSIEWCPHVNYLSYFVCGTYQLEGNTSESTSPPCRRKGRIYLFEFKTELNEFVELHRLETAAILDMKWLQQENFEVPILAAANALGQIEVFTLENDHLLRKTTFELNTEFHNLLALSLDWNWSTLSQPSDGRKIISSDSKGDVTLLEYHGEHLTKLNNWSAHSFEAWICAFDKWNPYLIFTGGDDTFLHAFDTRGPNKILTNKSHIAGVTCLLSHPKHENILLTGSYDERLRIFDVRSMKQPISDINLYGGIWRLKPDPYNKNLILAACMYKNFSIVQIGESKRDMTLMAEYNEHESICYGADWCLDTRKGNDGELFMATCSFYDHKLCLSKVLENK